MSKEELKTYLSDSIEVSSASPAEIDILKELGMVANAGWVVSDDGTILARLNNRGATIITLDVGDILRFLKEDKWRLKRVYISTASVPDLTFRYLFYNTKVKEVES